MSSNTNEYFIKLIDLLEIERKEDLRQYQLKLQNASLKEQKANGVVIYPLKHQEFKYVSGEQLVAVFTFPVNEGNAGHGFSNGKSVQLFALNDEGLSVQGVVNRVKKEKVIVTINSYEFPNWMTHNSVVMQLLFDDRTYKEMNFALKKVIDSENIRVDYFKKLFNGIVGPAIQSNKVHLPVQLNKSQCSAIQNIADASDYSVIHGPPGTGKTTTLVESIKNELTQVSQVLVCAPSNAAVDVVSERLEKEGVKVVRIGHPARVTDEMLNQTIEAKVAQHNDYKLYKDLKKRSDEYFKMAGKWKRSFGKEEREQRKFIYQEAKSLKNDAERVYKDIVDDLLFSTRVIASTLVGANHSKLRGMTFETVFIDEAGQALEPACWIPILKAKKVVFAGDHMQLPPTVKSLEAKKMGLDKTLFERLIEYNSCCSLLKEQYRMNDVIMQFSSKYFYDGMLKSADANRLATIIPNDDPMEFIDTAGTGYFEDQHPDTKSSFNTGEVEMIIKHLKTYINQILLAGYELPDNIGIISPYKAQIELFKSELEDAEIEDIIKRKLIVNTIDGFQG